MFDKAWVRLQDCWSVARWGRVTVDACMLSSQEAAHTTQWDKKGVSHHTLPNAILSRSFVSNGTEAISQTFCEITDPVHLIWNVFLYLCEICAQVGDVAMNGASSPVHSGLFCPLLLVSRLRSTLNVSLNVAFSLPPKDCWYTCFDKAEWKVCLMMPCSE